MECEEGEELSGQDPGLPSSVQTDVVRRRILRTELPQPSGVMEVSLDCNSGSLKILRHGEGTGELLPVVLPDLGDEVQVGGEHDLGPGHVEGVPPVPAVGEEIPDTAQLGGHDGEVAPVHLVGDGGWVDVGPREPRPVALQQGGDGRPEENVGLVVHVNTVTVVRSEDGRQGQLKIPRVTENSFSFQLKVQSTPT